MQTPATNPEKDAIVSEIHIEAPPESVFQALVDPAQVVRWWGQPGIYRCTQFHRDLRPGGKWSSHGLDAEGRTFQVTGEYLAVDPPRLLEYTWVASWTGVARTQVRWDLEPYGNGTRVTIRHSGFSGHPEIARSYRGWPRMLGWLQSLLEKGETVADRKPAVWDRS